MVQLSVLMPVYNTKEAHLRCAIESILNQTFADFKFLILDDGSTNNVSEVIRSYNDPRIEVIKNETNKGIIFTLNNALDNVDTEFIARMDSDDISKPRRFEKQIDFLKNNPDISLLGTSMQYFEGSKRKFYAPAGYKNIRFLMLRESVIAHPTVMFRKKDFQNFRYDANFKHVEDYELWCRAITELKFENLEEILLDYRIHKNQIGSRYNTVQIQNSLKIKKNYIKKIYQDLNPREIELFINMSAERRESVFVSIPEYENLVNKIIRYNVKTEFFDAEQLQNSLTNALNDLKFPKKRILSLKIGKNKYNLYKAQKNSVFTDEKLVFNRGFALSIKN